MIIYIVNKTHFDIITTYDLILNKDTIDIFSTNTLNQTKSHIIFNFDKTYTENISFKDGNSLIINYASSHKILSKTLIIDDEEIQLPIK